MNTVDGIDLESYIEIIDFADDDFEILGSRLGIQAASQIDQRHDAGAQCEYPVQVGMRFGDESNRDRIDDFSDFGDIQSIKDAADREFDDFKLVGARFKQNSFFIFHSNLPGSDVFSTISYSLSAGEFLLFPAEP